VNTFLADINNEYTDGRNETYATNFKSLNALVLVLFARDKTVVPRESQWFGSEAPPEENERGRVRAQFPIGRAPTIIPMRQQPLYKEDWIGLRTLDESGRVHLASCDGEHMQLPPECYEWIVKRWTGGKLD
jgi:palmitoyl-protein thioesterase